MVPGSGSWLMVGSTCHLFHAWQQAKLCLLPASCLAYSLTLKMEATCSSKMSGFSKLHSIITLKNVLSIYKCTNIIGVLQKEFL
jgi:hypothetical protein